MAFTAEMIYQECAYGKVAAMKGKSGVDFSMSHKSERLIVIIIGSWPANGDGNMLVTIEHS